jgi:hypothetical protein
VIQEEGLCVYNMHNIVEKHFSLKNKVRHFWANSILKNWLVKCQIRVSFVLLLKINSFVSDGNITGLFQHVCTGIIILVMSLKRENTRTNFACSNRQAAKRDF